MKKLQISALNRGNSWLVLTALALVLAGCDAAPGSQVDQAQIKSSHVDSSITPEQRIAKISSNPNLTDEQKAQFIARIKSKNKIP